MLIILSQRGFRIPYGGTNTHLMNLACNSVVGEDGTGLSGDMLPASWILPVSWSTAIPSPVITSGIRSRRASAWARPGSPSAASTRRKCDSWPISSLDVLFATHPHSRVGFVGQVRRAKVDFHILEDAKLKVRNLAESAGIDFTPTSHGYPHFYY